MSGLVRRKDLLKFFRISNTTLYERIADGSIPKPFYIGEGRTPYWRQSDIERLVAERVAAANGEPISASA